MPRIFDNEHFHHWKIIHTQGADADWHHILQTTMFSTEILEYHSGHKKIYNSVKITEINKN